MARVQNLFLIFAAIFNIANGATFEGYIIGGNVSAPEDAPYQVSLRQADMSHVCGGAIIDTRWILTTASCVYNIYPTYIVAGSNLLNSTETVFNVLFSIQHLWFDPKTLQHDIALIKTTKTIVYTSRIQPVILPSRNILDGEVLTLAGWGLKNIGGIFPNSLQIANVKTISNLECQNRLLSQNMTVYYSNVCTFTELGACTGDFGGPLISSGVVHALASRAVTNCTKLYPEINIRVYHYNIWIMLTQFFFFWK